MPGTSPNSGTPKDKRITGRGATPGPKKGSKNGGPSQAKPENKRGKK